MLLTMGSALMGVALSLIKIAREDTLYLVFVPIFIADVSMVLNFLFRDLRNVVMGSLEVSGWCQFSAIWTITACVALNVNAVAVAYYTRELVYDRLDRRNMKRELVYITAAGWTAGLAAALTFYGRGQLGDFKGIYCCVSTITAWNVAIPFILANIIALSTMIYFHRAAFLHVKQISVTTTKMFQSSSPGGTMMTPEHVTGLFKLSTTLVINFYVCWTLVAVLAIFEAMNVHYPVEWDVAAGWLLKLQPILDSIMVIRGFRRTIFRKLASRRSSHGPPTRKELGLKTGDELNLLSTSPSAKPDASLVVSPVFEIKRDAEVTKDDMHVALALSRPLGLASDRAVKKDYLDLQEGKPF